MTYLHYFKTLNSLNNVLLCKEFLSQMGVEVYQVVFLLYSVTVVKLFIDFLM